MGFFDALLAGAGQGLSAYRQGQFQTRQYLQKQDEDREEKLRRRILDQARIDLQEAQTEKARAVKPPYDPETDEPLQHERQMKKEGLGSYDPNKPKPAPQYGTPEYIKRRIATNQALKDAGLGGSAASEDRTVERNTADARADENAMRLVQVYGGIEDGGIDKALAAQSKFIQNAPSSDDAKRLYAALVRLQKSQFTKPEGVKLDPKTQARIDSLKASYNNKKK